MKLYQVRYSCVSSKDTFSLGVPCDINRAHHVAEENRLHYGEGTYSFWVEEVE